MGVGWLTVDAGIHFPGEKYAGIDALHAHDAMFASGNMGVMLLFAAVAELTSMVSVVQAAKGSGRAAGDFGLDPLEFCGNPDTKKFMLEAETTHARLLGPLHAVGAARVAHVPVPVVGGWSRLFSS